jgi:hypothetical protein
VFVACQCEVTWTQETPPNTGRGRRVGENRLATGAQIGVGVPVETGAKSRIFQEDPGAERGSVVEPIHTTPITPETLWARAATDMSQKPYQALGTGLLDAPVCDREQV